MTPPSDQTFDPSGLIPLLVEGGLVVQGDAVSLNEYAPAFPRHANLRRWHYNVCQREKKICHLIVGRELATVHDRAKGIAGACPEITCRPLFFHQRNDGLGILCLEHFEGESLDTLVEKGRCSAALWLEHVRKVQNALEHTRNGSTPEQLKDELQSSIASASRYPGLTEFDKHFLTGPVQHAILAGALANPARRQWSNGDFIGRNILVGQKGEVRLIDYEYAEFTHFGDADWLRLMEFSVLPSDLNREAIPELHATTRPWVEIWMWVHQLVQLRNVQPSSAVSYHLTEAVGRLLMAVDQARPSTSQQGPESLLVQLIADRQRRQDALVSERTAWARSLENELQSAEKNFKRLTEEHAGRSTWAKSLEQQLTTAQTNFEKLNQEFKERTAWAESLQAAYRQTQSDFERLSREFDERTKWTLSLEAERDQLNAELNVLREQKALSAASLRVLEEKSLEIGEWIPGSANQGIGCILDGALVALAGLKRDLAVKNAEKDQLAGAHLEARLTAEAAGLEVLRLTAALQDAQIHLEGLLRQSAVLRERNHRLETGRTDAAQSHQANKLPADAQPSRQ